MCVRILLGTPAIAVLASNSRNARDHAAHRHVDDERQTCLKPAISGSDERLSIFFRERLGDTGASIGAVVASIKYINADGSQRYRYLRDDNIKQACK